MKSGINVFTPALPGREARAVPEFTSSGFARRFCRLSPGMFLAQVFFCALPAGALLASGRIALAGYYFWAALGLMLLRMGLVGRRDEMLCLILAVGPFINLLRGFAFYNIAIGLFGVSLTFYFVLSSGVIRDALKRAPLIWSLAISVLIFYLISFLNTRDYSVNLRLFEMVLAATVVLIIGRSPSLLAIALLGLLCSALVVGLSLLPHTVAGGRLGIITNNEQTLGNPTQLGVPLAFGFLALIADRGRWLKLEANPLWRLLLVIPTVAVLALTTSRASWLIAAGGILLCVIFGSRQRWKVFIVVLLGCAALKAILHSPYGSSLEKGLERTFGGKSSVSHRTSGRSDQWKVSWHAFTRSTEAMVHGYGPGRGPEVYAKYSFLVGGVKYGVGKPAALHSLFMQVAVESGLIGLSLLVVWLAVCLFKVLRNLFETGLIFPFVCLFGYVADVAAASGGDTNAGVFLGVALLGTARAAMNSEPEDPSARGNEELFKTNPAYR